MRWPSAWNIARFGICDEVGPEVLGVCVLEQDEVAIRRQAPAIQDEQRR